ncbi:MAG: hypothetical protein HY289_05215 [Planctomycetes bacterium]|nr:hypothetical protein [Planctomycetota bacterium]
MKGSDVPYTMKVIEKNKATATLAAFADDIVSGPVVVTDSGKPIAVLVPLVNADLETVSLSTNPRFIELIERSRARVRKEGAISSKEMRRRFERKQK